MSSTGIKINARHDAESGVPRFLYSNVYDELNVNPKFFFLFQSGSQVDNKDTYLLASLEMITKYLT